MFLITELYLWLYACLWQNTTRVTTKSALFEGVVYIAANVWFNFTFPTNIFAPFDETKVFLQPDC